MTRLVRVANAGLKVALLSRSCERAARVADKGLKGARFGERLIADEDGAVRDG
jgi:hypothetical protein